MKSWGQITILDAQDVLSRFMVDGTPDEARFKTVIGELIGSITWPRGRFRDVRVYGEMVNLLWSDNLPAAARLEELWNDVIEEDSISLFCAYCLDGGGQPDACSRRTSARSTRTSSRSRVAPSRRSPQSGSGLFRTRLATTAASSAGCTGLGTCIWNPARSTLTRRGQWRTRSAPRPASFPPCSSG